MENEIQQAAKKLNQFRAEIGKVIVGHQEVIEQVLTGLLTGGHILLEGVPGIGKTLLVKTLSQCLNLSFSRIQCTPDLMPADITGTNIIVEEPSGQKVFQFQPGPIFHNIILIDEINRATPKTQSALLEAMQELSVTVGGVKYELPRPFIVFATQNPIEMEGTYPLPEAQLDRFFYKIMIHSPTLAELNEIVRRTTGQAAQPVVPVLNKDEILHLSELVRQIPIAPHLVEYVSKLVLASHPGQEFSPALVKQYVRYGASPRAAQSIVLAAKALALMEGKLNAVESNLVKAAYPALRHRLILNLEAETSAITPEQIIDEIISQTPRLPAEVMNIISLTQP